MTNKDSIFGAVNKEWFEGVKEIAERARMEEKVKKLIDEDPEYIDKSEVIKIQIQMLKEKEHELLQELEDLRGEIGNKHLEKMGSKYRFGVSKDNIKT